jgi:hypothetical protein
MTISTQGSKIFWVIVLVIAVYMMYVQLSNIFWYKTTPITTIGQQLPPLFSLIPAILFSLAMTTYGSILNRTIFSLSPAVCWSSAVNTVGSNAPNLFSISSFHKHNGPPFTEGQPFDSLPLRSGERVCFRLICSQICIPVNDRFVSVCISYSGKNCSVSIHP